MKPLVYGLLILLALAHQDFWWWDDAETMVFGFMPVGLAYHAGISVAAAALWAMAVRYCWPHGVDVLDDARLTRPRDAAEPSRDRQGADTNPNGDRQGAVSRGNDGPLPPSHGDGADA